MRFAFAFLLYFQISSQIAWGALQIVNAGVRQIEDGPAVAGVQFVPGETLYYSFQIANYTVTQGDPLNRKVRFSYTMDVFDPKGVKLAETVESVLDTTVSKEDKEWKPKVRLEVLIPHFAPPGKYKVVTKLKDDLSLQTATAETFFEVMGRAVEPSTELIVRDFNFYRSENDQKPLKTAAYTAGDTLFARFDITGFRYGDRNSIEVTYDVAVENPDGKVIYTQPAAAVEKSFSFYPKAYVPGGLSLDLQPNMRKGQYTVVLTVHDVAGKQTFEDRHPFHVE